MDAGVSVIICCYNSERLIEETLLHLVNQTMHDSLKWEVILVDNNCTDDTVQKAQRFWNKSLSFFIPFKIVKEPAPGLMHARQAGIKAANYEITIFCDDDNHLFPNYLETAYQQMASNKAIGVLGGCSIAKFESKPPPWFEEVKESYAVGSITTLKGDITFSIGHVWGAGMVCRTSVIKEVLKEGFITSGRKGKNLASGDDTEVCYKTIRKGFRIFYDPDLKLYHYIIERRLQWKYAIKLHEGHTITSVKLATLRQVSFKNDQKDNKLKLLKDLAYLTYHNCNLKALMKINKIKNLEKYEGDFGLWKSYFKFFYLYSFLKYRVVAQIV